MSVIKKIWNSLILRSVFAVCTGTAVVVAFIALLSLYGVSQETAPAAKTQALRFPENEQMLDAMSAQLAGNSPAVLSNIAPAAGDAQPPLKTK